MDRRRGTSDGLGDAAHLAIGQAVAKADIHPERILHGGRAAAILGPPLQMRLILIPVNGFVSLFREGIDAVHRLATAME